MNLRSSFEKKGNMLVLLGPDFDIPAELQQDVVLLEEDLPSEEEYAGITAELMSGNDLPQPSTEDLSKASILLKGLMPFRAKQTAAMSMTKNGLDLAALREFKRQAIAEHRGITMDEDNPNLTFENIGGLGEVTSFFHRVMTGAEPPNSVFRIDELEKALAGAGGRNSEGDSSGTSHDMLLNFLNAIEDKGWSFSIFIGPGGSGKSLVTKCLGPTYGIPSFTVDLGATKGPLVGESQQNIRTLLSVMDGIAGKDALIIGTCNKLESIPPELKRRVTDGFWFFDIPKAEELVSIWSINMRQFGITEQPIPPCTNWTGAEVRTCCRLARKLRCSLEQASKYVVPIWLSGQQSIQELRNMAHETFLDASAPGSYRKPVLTSTATPKEEIPTGRTLRLREEE
jgi:SpoVK/Ycf46/Vps4 family AAA+-type ATPase